MPDPIGHPSHYNPVEKSPIITTGNIVLTLHKTKFHHIGIAAGGMKRQYLLRD
jgi:hypothetical protein